MGICAIAHLSPTHLRHPASTKKHHTMCSRISITTVDAQFTVIVTRSADSAKYTQSVSGGRSS